MFRFVLQYSFRMLPLIICLLGTSTVEARAQTTETRTVLFNLSGRVTAALDGAAIERARIVIADPDDGRVLLDRAFSSANGEYMAPFEDQVEVTVGILDPRGGGGDPHTVGRWMGALPNPVVGGGELQLVLPWAAPDRIAAAPELEVFDLRGRRQRPAEGLASGIYLYRLRFSDRVLPARKLTVLGPTRAAIELQRVSRPEVVGTGDAEGAPAGSGDVGGIRRDKRVQAMTVVRVRVERAGYVADEALVTVDAETGAVHDVALAVEPIPTAAFVVSDSTVAGQPVIFDGSPSVAADGQPLNYSWDFGDGQHGGGSQVAHVYTQPGDYTVVLTVAGTYGATHSDSSVVTITPADPPATQSAQLVGSITDVAGNMLRDVQATIVGTAIADTSGADGSLTLLNVPTGVPIAVRLHRDGYAEQVVRTRLPAGADFGTFEASLIARGSPLVIGAAEDGGSFRGSAGARVVLPVDGLVHPDGSLVTGEVTLRMTPLDPGDELENFAFPGGYEALRTTGDLGLLLSYGVSEYVFEQNGTPLQLAPGRCATVEIPLYAPGAQVGDRIALWSMDPSTGLWREEGMGEVVFSLDNPLGVALRAEVTHFSWWNADKFEVDPYRVIPECKIKDQNGLPTLQIPPGESCYIQGRSLGADGPFGNPDVLIGRNNASLLALPAATSMSLTASTSNGTHRGSVVISGNSGVTEAIEIPLDPVPAGGGALLLPSEVSGVIDPPGEVDTYTLDLISGQRLSVAVTRIGGGSSLSGQIRLLDPSGAPIDSSAFGSSVGTILQEIVDSGTHTLEVRGDSGQSGGYDLRAELVQDREVALGVPVEFETYPGRAQTYTFDATAGTWISLGQRRIAGLSGGRGRFEVYRPDGTLLTTRLFSFSGYDMGLLQLDASGTWTVAVFVDDLEGTLVVRIDDVPRLPLDTTVQGALEAKTTRYFEIEARDGQGIRGALNAASDLAGSVGFINASGGAGSFDQQTIDLFDGSDATPVLEVRQDGPWFLRVSAGFSSNTRETRPYAAIVHEARPPVPVGFDASGHGVFHADIDRFGAVRLRQFELQVGEGLEIVLRSVAGETDPGVKAAARLYEVGSGSLIAPASSLGFGSEIDRFDGDAAFGILEYFVMRAEQAGTYVLALGALDGATGSFDVQIDRAPAVTPLLVDEDLQECPSASTRSLAAALAAAPDGGTIDICAGEFWTPTAFQAVANDLIVRGAGAAATVLRGSSNGPVLYFQQNVTTVEDLSVRPEKGSASTGIKIQSPAGFVVQRVTVEPWSGSVSVGRGIDAGGGNGGTIAHCRFMNNERAVSARTDDLVFEDNQIDGGFGKVEFSAAQRAIIRRNVFLTDEVGTVIGIELGAGHQVLDNDITIATTDIGANLNSFAMEISEEDVQGDQVATLVRGNVIVSNEAGLRLTVRRESSHIVAEQNTFTCTDPKGRRGLALYGNRADPDQSIVVRNNTFDQVSLFEAVTVFAADRFDLDIVNNSFRVAAGALVQTNYVFLELTPVQATGTALPARFVNNVVEGPGGGTAVLTNDATTFTSDYNVWTSFQTYYDGGMTGGGPQEIVGGSAGFADASLRLDPTSPAVDSGATPAEFATVPTVDVSGAARPQGAGYDRGAWER